MGMQIGRYETLREIASGGMATVHLARASGAGGFERLFAVKMMHAHIAKEPDAVSMFLDEARLAARIRHPNVVATIDVLETDAGLAIVMEYIEGPSLSMMFKALGKKERTVSVEISLRILLDGLAGLDAAHDLTDGDEQPLNLVHRDVSPQNLIVGVNGITRITDFGVARAEARLQSTRSSQLKGKLAYMAPEQIAGMPVDRRSDVYAAGVVFWELLTGRRLFRADNEAALVSAVAGGVTKSPHELHAGVPMSVDRACMRALCPQPSGRFPTAAAFAEAIEDAAGSVGLRIASHKTVAKFVKALGAHERPVGLPDAPSTPSGSGSESSLPRYPSSSRLTPISRTSGISGGAISGSGAELVADSGRRDIPPSGRELQSDATHIATVVEKPGSPKHGGRIRMLLGVAGAAVVGAVAALVLLPQEGDDRSVAASADELAETPTQSETDVAPATPEVSARGEAKDDVDGVDSSEPSGSAPPSVAAGQPAVAAPPTGHPASPRVRKTPDTKKPTTPSTSATVFETTDL